MEFQNAVDFDSNAKEDKHVSQKGFDSLLLKANISHFRASSNEQAMPIETNGALETIAIDEEERQSFVTTLTRMRPGLQ